MTINATSSHAVLDAIQAINQNPITLRHRRGTPTDASAVMAAHQRLPSATQSNYDIDWPVHSLMLSFDDLRGLPLRRLSSTEPCGMILWYGRPGTLGLLVYRWSVGVWPSPASNAALSSVFDRLLWWRRGWDRGSKYQLSKKLNDALV